MRFVMGMMKRKLIEEKIGVEEVEAVFEADIDEACRLLHVGRAPLAEHLAAATEGAGAETQDGDFEAGSAQLTVFHACVLISGGSDGAAQRPAGPETARRDPSCAGC